MAELKVFKDNEVKKMESEFLGFSLKECWIDDFCFKTVGVAKYKEFCFFLKLLLTMRHSQAAVERGFSHNNAILKINMSPETVVSKRMIKDHLLSVNMKPHTIEIRNPLIVAFKSSHRRYEIYLEEHKKKNKWPKPKKKKLYILRQILTSWRWNEGCWKEPWKWLRVNLLSALDQLKIKLTSSYESFISRLKLNKIFAKDEI